MPSLFVENVPAALHERLQRLAAATEGGKRAVVLEALGVFLDRQRTKVTGLDLAAAAAAARHILNDPDSVSLPEIAKALRLLVDAICDQQPSRNRDVSIETVATARDARRMATQIVRDDALVAISPPLPPGSPSACDLLIWARAWLTTAIAICVEEHRFDWRSALERAESGPHLDKALDLGEFSTLADDWNLTTWHAIPERCRDNALTVIRAALSPLLEGANR